MCEVCQYMEACEECSDFTQRCVHMHTHIHTVCDSMMYSLHPTLFLLIPLPLYSMCALPLTYFSTEHTHCSGEENTAILSHPSVILSLYSSFSTPELFVSALLSSSLTFPSSATHPFLHPFLSLLFATHSFLSCLCPQDTFCLSLFLSFPTLSSHFHLAFHIFFPYPTFFFFFLICSHTLSLAVLVRLLMRHVFPSPFLI